jgi:hypothetical protein
MKFALHTRGERRHITACSGAENYPFCRGTRPNIQAQMHQQVRVHNLLMNYYCTLTGNRLRHSGIAGGSRL